MKNTIFFNDISPSITIFIVSYSIISSGHYTSRREDKAESGPGLRISDAEESDGIGKTRISFPWNLIGASKGLPRTFSPNIFHVHM